MKLPSLPVPISQFPKYSSECTNRTDLWELVKPFTAYESKLREIFAQHPDHPAVKDNHLVPVFSNNAPLPVIRARDLGTESDSVKDSYLLPLDDKSRRPNGSPATVKSLAEFRNNFSIFSESSLSDLDWNNVIAAGSSVVTALLPVDAPHNESKRALRTYYHQTMAPASDVDLFLYGLDEEQAKEKIKQIESKIKDSILSETTTIRTKNAITIVSEYPTRHVQIVLRLYKSKSEVLTGFDVDCACVAYDGQQVWATPRALTAFMTQVNTIDLTRRSPSYENRLSKYSHRGFEVYWPTLDRSRVDPTIFERSFSRVKGLARLLVLEKLPHPDDRDTYAAKRREERGRPAVPWNHRYRHQLAGNVKDAQPDDVAEWVDGDEISNYHTFTIPYGPKYNPRKIEKLVYTQDLLLNAEWNRPKDRLTKLHRHPAFFGTVEDVMGDCCGSCPQPESDEDLKVLEEESATYISGAIKFLKDDPGRQAIGSFNPISDEDWTEIAYVGNTTRLCQAIVDRDLEAVEDWFSSGDPEEVLDVNRRDHAGRTPLLLAAMASTPEIVEFLVERGARLVSRLYNGMTALHFAAYRGETEMIKILLRKSEINEKAQARKEDAKRAARRAAAEQVTNGSKAEEKRANSESGSDSSSESSEGDTRDDLTEGSFVKVPESPDERLEDDLSEPDVYDVNLLAWDQPMSPLHLAIIASKPEAVKVLVKEFGADVLRPVIGPRRGDYQGAEVVILTLVLALEAPLHTSRQTVDALLSVGATATQADANERSALQYAISQAKDSIVSAMVSNTDPDRLKKAINHLSTTKGSHYWSQMSVVTPLVTAIHSRDSNIIGRVLDSGASLTISFESWRAIVQRCKMNSYISDWEPDKILDTFRSSVQQPITVAAQFELPGIVSRLIDMGADVNTLPPEGWSWLTNSRSTQSNKSLLDLVRDRMRELEKSDRETTGFKKPELLDSDEAYMNFPVGSYQHWTATYDLVQAKIVKRVQMKAYDTELKRLEDAREQAGAREKKRQIKETLEALRALEKKIVSKGGKTFYELHPDAKPGYETQVVASTVEDKNSISFKFPFSFEKAGLEEGKRQAYLSMFEAAFTGDIETVKKLSLDATSPLLVSTQDLAGFSPFILAVLRGHYHLATTILDIATVQYQPPKNDKDKPKYKYCLANNAHEDDSEDDSDDGDHGSKSPLVLRELVDERFTIEDITALADRANSSISPSDILNSHAGVWRAFGTKPEVALKEFNLEQEFPKYHVSNVTGIRGAETSQRWFNEALPQEVKRCSRSLVRYAIAKKDTKMLRFLLAAGEKFGHKILDVDFKFALRRGETEMVDEIIKVTGHRMNLDLMVSRAGANVAEEEKPDFYQGLTVYGHKRKDWAERARGGNQVHPVHDTSPLLDAVYQGNLSSIEYYLSDRPLKRYMEFATTHRDKRVKALEEAKGGLEGVLKGWLWARSELVAHLAVMAKPAAKGNPLLERVLKAVPRSLEAKSSNALTPLHVAFYMGRIESARILLEVGADPNTKDYEGRNVLHTLLQNRQWVDPQVVAYLLELLGRETAKSLLLQKYHDPIQGPLTPLALYMQQDKPDSKVLHIILGYSQGQDLEIMNGTGDYSLHALVRAEKAELVKFLVEYRPEMLWWENATGLTPIDVARAARLQYIVENPPDLPSDKFNHHYDYMWNLRPASEFAPQELSEEEKAVQELLDLEADDLKAAKERHWYMLALLEKLAERFPGQRKLVSVFDANEVARRLAREQRENNEETRRQEGLGMHAKGMRNRAMYRLGRRRRNLNTRTIRGARGIWVDVDREQEEDEVEYWLEMAQTWAQADQYMWLKKQPSPP